MLGCLAVPLFTIVVAVTGTPTNGNLRPLDFEAPKYDLHLDYAPKVNARSLVFFS